MAVLLGCGGSIELKRTQLDEDITGDVRQSDVNADKDRFSFDFPSGMLLTGDQVELSTTDDSTLDFIAPSAWPTNTVYRDGVFYIYVDEVGAIRLYSTFDDALAGESQGRIDLVDAGRTVPIRIRVRNNNFRMLGQIRQFELNTERDAIDITALSQEFRSNYSGLISGSGRITCFFDYEQQMSGCDPMTASLQGEIEMPIYVHQLLLRTRVGSEFRAKVTLVARGPKASGSVTDVDDQIWYEFDARLTNVGISFEPTQPIETTIDYVTTGEIKLRTQYTSNYLLQEDYGLIQLEANQSGFLEVQQQE